jgi:hypothetical protein
MLWYVQSFLFFYMQAWETIPLTIKNVQPPDANVQNPMNYDFKDTQKCTESNRQAEVPVP